MKSHIFASKLMYLFGQNSVVYYFMSYNAIKCSREHNIFNIYPEHFALFASFAVCDFSHRKERKVCKDLFKLFGFWLFLTFILTSWF